MTEEFSHNGKSYMGVNHHKAFNPTLIQPNDSLKFCDLRDYSFNSMDLTQVRFFGCYLNGTLFERSVIQEVQFIGCFSSERGSPTSFRESVYQSILNVDSHIYCVGDMESFFIERWTTEVAEATWNTLAERNDVRYYAVKKLGDLGDPVVTPILCCMLTDHEWDVRSVALEALGRLRKTRFPHEDHVILEWMFLRLGDDHSIVRQTARNLIEQLEPSDEILQVSVSQIEDEASEKQLNGLRAAIELCIFDPSYSRLLTVETLQKLRFSEILEVREECLYLLDLLEMN